MPRWLLVRHAATIWSGSGAYAGWSDVPLSAGGRAAAVRLGRRLAGTPLGAAWTSDLRRAGQTLALVLDQRRPDVVRRDTGGADGSDLRPTGWPSVRVDPDLRELSFGAWEGRTYAEIAGEPDGAGALAGAGAAPGGESLSDLTVRVGRVFDDLRAGACRPVGGGGSGLADSREGVAPETTLVVTHGGPLRVMLCLALGLPSSEQWRFEVGYASLTEIAWDDVTGARLVRLNDVSHLSPGVPGGPPGGLPGDPPDDDTDVATADGDEALNDWRARLGAGRPAGMRR